MSNPCGTDLPWCIRTTLRLSLRAQLPELESLETILADLPAENSRVLATVQHGNESLPIYAVALGANDPRLPTIAFIGGVHGLERVGTQVLLSYLRTLKSSLTWDHLFKQMLTQIRVVMIPLLNPVGMALKLRSNGRGVDLMRNAPVHAEHKSRWFELHRGQRVTPFLPWYQGKVDALELEAQVLCDYIEQQLFESEFALAVDVHSGFLAGDRLWFPYARSQRPFAHTPEVMALTLLLADAHENHVYTVEPQSMNYTTHGDLWDYIYDRHQALGRESEFLPLTLEISSSLWYRKNPRQLVNRLGLFHPILEHRLARAQRRHKTLFDFLTRAVLSHSEWRPHTPAHRLGLQREAQERWFCRM